MRGRQLGRRRLPAWRVALFVDGLVIGFLTGVIACGAFANIIVRVWG